MNFGEALKVIKNGGSCARPSFGDKVIVVDKDAMMILLRCIRGQQHPWFAQSTDLLADDWEQRG